MTTIPDAMSLADRGGPDGRYLVGSAQPNEANVDVSAQRSEALSRVLSVLEDSWHAIQARHPQVPPVVIIIASGTSGRGAKWGHFDPRRWTVDAAGTLAEILISGEGLHRSPRAVLGTLKPPTPWPPPAASRTPAASIATTIANSRSWPKNSGWPSTTTSASAGR